MTNNQPYNPLVSIALTTFNGRHFIKEQIDSILAQTYQNFEIVISDDGSDKETIDILNAYVAQNSRVRWSRSPLERGYRKNTENAISLCRGEIIFLCDQDDTWYPERLQLHVNAYKDSSVQWVFNRLVITDSINNPIGYIEDTLPDYYRHKTMLENVWGSCIGGAMTSYRAECIKKALPIPSYAPAHDSWIQFAIFPAKSIFIDKVLQTYRQHNNNQVGMAVATDMEAKKQLEEESILANYYRLKMYAREPHLQIWKRGFVLIVYYLKKIRYILRRLVGKTDAKIT